MSRDPHPHSPIPARREPPATAGAVTPSETPLLSMHAAVVFLTAVIIGLVMGSLTFLHDKSVPAAVAAGLGTFGISVPVLHKLIG
ncbi:hypothetical protein [Streptomyces sp. enrichment culture]|uniref:hypothetical protein n=1 Tax=Streptomyces sp. enrichment culture TaxID=1795815 RepID=UPI003F56F120